MRGQIAQAANTHMIKIGSSVNCKEWWHENVPVTKAVSFCMRLLLNFQGAYSWPHILRTLTCHVGEPSFFVKVVKFVAKSPNGRKVRGSLADLQWESLKNSLSTHKTKISGQRHYSFLTIGIPVCRDLKFDTTPIFPPIENYYSGKYSAGVTLSSVYLATSSIVTKF
ncbi:hypothetical protein AVEN_86283-1 [Araneus ventricosus]|uniref:Uncharacterized protein n=1 Tax=Araneus ventricosus TaxID=182803 RepID=A0A4Y2KB16_ARAVE|nr:hypothetical protein AVEN_86283-1 [Araneus ventricosus]